MEPTNPNEHEQNFDNGNNDNSLHNINPHILRQPTGMENIFEELTMMAMRKKDSGLDISNLNPNQVDKLLDTIAKNEENMFAYHSKKLDTQKEIKFKEIGASIVDEHTNRYVCLAALLLVALLTILIMLLQEKYFMPWLTFLTGLAGGFGISKIPNKRSKSKKQQSEDDHEE